MFTSKPALRDYQLETVSCIFHEWETVRRTLAVLPTGGGKSAIAAEVIRRRLPGRALFVCHREELVWQFRETAKRFAGVECGIEMADLSVNGSLFADQPVIISTVQTLNSAWGDRLRMGRFDPKDFDTLICDEFHHATSKTWKAVMDYMTQNPKLKVLGITATPDRADEEALGQVCDTVAIDIEILDLINDGYLVPIQQQFVSVSGMDFSHMRTTAGDLNGADLAALMEAEKTMQGVTAASIQIIGDKRAILFTCSVKQAEQACEIFNRHRPGMADWVCGATNKDDRREKLSNFKSGKTQVMCNCGVLTEGFDDPGVEVIIMGRPTKSRSLYAQMAGRGTRPLEGIVDGPPTAEARIQAIQNSAKPHCTVLDFVGNSGKHKLMSTADILGGKVSDKAIENAIAKAKKDGGAVRMDAALSEEEEKLRQAVIAAKLAAEARRTKLVARVQYSSKEINPFDAFDIQPMKTRGWDSGKVLSEKQAALLLKQGINPDKMSYTESRQVIAEIFRRWDRRLCTVKQASLLKKHGYETKDLTMDKATQLITAIKNNGWKRPATSEPIMAGGQIDDERVIWENLPA